eukprot:TRINITY_DN2013_c0_g1_i1.p1 TRINITY_DN2013_c0_g1~~TRINITY_DN2013_c0_g1_i1.p1  ORF type:complete len:255 (-),score=61.59 TRINITY_DN2013_c0_g1_i1:12-746(-)
MASHAEEQEDELIAMESIYMDGVFERFPTTPASFKITVTVEPETSDDHEVCADLMVQYTPNYPDEVPELRVEARQGLGAEVIPELVAKLDETARESVGMVMAMQLVDTLTEHLRPLTQKPTNLYQEMMVRIRLEEEKKRAESHDTCGDILEGEEAYDREQDVTPKTYTPVTPETFAVWLKTFLAEKAVLEKERSGVVEDLKKRRRTGRELFEEDKRLDQSDLTFSEDDEEVAETPKNEVDTETK